MDAGTDDDVDRPKGGSLSLYGGITLPGQPDLENIRRLDLLPIPCVMEMMRFGMQIDPDHFHQLSATLAVEMDELKRGICSYIPPEKLDEFIGRSNMDAEDDYLPMNVDSNRQLAMLLFEVLGIGKDKVLKRTKSGDQISTGKRQLEQLRRSHPVLPLVLKYREFAKLKSTYTDALPEQAVWHPAGPCDICHIQDIEDEDGNKPYAQGHLDSGWYVHTQLLWTRTSTGRYASKKPNLQNQPIRSKYGRESRRGFIAPPGMVIVSVDFSQLQLRFLAHAAMEEKMIWIFENGKDPHTMTAIWTFDKSHEEVESDYGKLAYRAPAKNVNFALAFGETPKGLFDQLVSDSYGKSDLEVPDWLTLDWCKEFFAKWHGIYPSVGPFMDNQYYRARWYGIVWDMFGRIRRVPEVRSEHKRIVAAGLRQAGNHPIQAPDSGVMRLALAEWYDTIIVPVRKEGIRIWPLMTVHDEGLVAVDEEYGEIVKAAMIAVAERVLTDRQTGQNMCRVPIRADGKVMKRWEK